MTVVDRDKIDTYRPDDHGRISLSRKRAGRTVEIAVLDDATQNDPLGPSCVILDVPAVDVRTVSPNADGRVYLSEYSDRDELGVAILDDGGEA